MILEALPIFDTINAFAQIATLVVLLGTAIAALAQIRHLRAGNELEALLQLSEELESERMQVALRFVRFGLDEALERPAYRRDLTELGFVDASVHPEMIACNWFDRVGSLVKLRLIDERTFLDLFARLTTYYWDHLAPAVALLRRERGVGQYENFEYLAALARAWKAHHPEGTYPKGTARLAIVDRFSDRDRGIAGDGGSIAP